MDVKLWFDYHTGKATELTDQIPTILRSAQKYVSKAEMIEMLPSGLRVYVQKDQPRTLDTVLENLVERDERLEVSTKDGVEVFRYRQ